MNPGGIKITISNKKIGKINSNKIQLNNLSTPIQSKSKADKLLPNPSNLT